MNSTELGTFGDVVVTVSDDHVATVEIRRPPNNFFSLGLIDSLVAAFEAVDADRRCRSIVLCSQGKHFCAGADFGGEADDAAEAVLNPDGTPSHLYDAAVGLFSSKTPVVAAV